MAEETLLDIVYTRFAARIERDSDAGRLLDALVPQPPLATDALSGQADQTGLTLAPTGDGVSVRAAGASDALVLSVPLGPIPFTITPPQGAQPAEVTLTLAAVTVPLSPALRAARKTDAQTLAEAAGDVKLKLPPLLLVVTAGTGATVASLRLTPESREGGGLEVTMDPPYAGIGPDVAVGLGFTRGTLALDDAQGAAVLVDDVELFVTPPGIPALAMRGTGQDLRIALGNGGGLSGDFTLALAGAPATRPAFLQELSCRLRLHQSAVTLAEISGKIDLHGEIDRRLPGPPLGDPPAGPLGFTLSLTLDGAAWRVSLHLSGAAGGYLWRTSGAESVPRNTLGAYAAFAPLLAPTLPGAGADGYVGLGALAGMAAGVATVVKTDSLTLFGAELIVHDPASPDAKAFLFCDLETELRFDAEPLLFSRRPMKVRHQALGFELEFGGGGANPSLKPVFDPARGFGFDLSDPGAFAVPGPLGEIVQPEGARMARQNPLIFETDLALKADLGVVTVDRATVRVPIDPVGPPSITALGARVDVPGALTGSGYLKLSEDGFAGSLDAALTPLGVRVAAGLKIEQHDPVSAVLTTLGVKLPIPIPLANSGLGLFGFLGLFGMHFQRKQSEPTALEWYKGTAAYDASRFEAWQAAPRQWAIGLGALFGTVEGGFLVHAKGMVLIEAPGPRVLVLMDADILNPLPSLESQETGTLLAVIDISPDALTMGLIFAYDKLEPLLTIYLPAEAFFNFNQAADWRLDVGGIPPAKVPASVSFLNRLRAEGYLLIHGNGIADFPLGKLDGFAAAAGVRVALTWGPKEIGLYLEIAAQADLGISFKPFLILGRMALSGELHLFIVGIEASASATVTIVPGLPGTPSNLHVLAEVCGKVDFFFFDVEGCVTFELGKKPPQLPTAEPLLRAVSLHSRTPALLLGSSGDRPVDGSLGDAARLESNGQLAGEAPVVPIDAIPVLQFEMAPHVDTECKFFTTAVPAKLGSNDWVRRGRRAYRYTLRSVTLDPAPSGDDRPVVWWDRAPKSGGADRDVQLALLSWIPDPTPAAAERTVSLDERVTQRWGTVCAEPAAPAPVLWSFQGAMTGPSPAGWTRRGIPWSDEPDFWRSAPPPDLLHVAEPWRSGDRLRDGLLDVVPAIAFGLVWSAERALLAPRTGPEPRPAVADDQRLVGLTEALGPPAARGLGDALRLATDGLHKVQLLLAIDPRVWEGDQLRLRALDATGMETDLIVINPQTSSAVGSLNDLPPMWIESDKPWQGPVNDAYDWATNALNDLHLRLVLVTYGPPEGTTQIEIGAEGDVITTSDDPAARYWGIILMENLSAAEMLRYDHDATTRQAEIDVVNGALGADQAKRALLAPDTDYTIAVTYDVAIGDVDDKGNIAPAGTLTDQTQRFRFRTDNLPPARLDPWVLASDPAPGEQACFWGDPLRIVFATNATRALFKAYDRELFAVARAASGRRPPQTDGFDPWRVSLEETLTDAKPIAAMAVTPWQSALGEAIASAECDEFEGRAGDHELTTLQMLLEPSTEYILDLEPEPPVPDPDGFTPPFRRHFATGRYQSAATFAAAVHGTSPRHRYLADPAPLTALGAGTPEGGVAFVRDIDFERALRAAAWGDLAQPRAPRATVIWHDGIGDTPQPVALLLEAPEPFWRQREVPRELPDDAGTRRFQMVAEPWLEVAATTPALVTRLAATTAGNRTLVLLRPSARGETLTLALRHRHHPLFDGDAASEDFPLVTADLTRAPWEA